MLLNIAAHGKLWAFLIYILTVLAFAAVIYFVGAPFAATDGSYRLYYRDVAKEKRLEMLRRAEESSNNYSPQQATRTASNYQIYDALFKVANSFYFKKTIPINARSSITNIRLYLSSAEESNISYTLYYTYYLEINTSENPTATELFINNFEERASVKLAEFEREIINKSISALRNIGASVAGSEIQIYHNMDKDIRTY